MNTLNNLKDSNTLTLDVTKDIDISLAEEKHEHTYKHDSWGGDIGRAALGGAITGLVTGVSMQAGKFAGKYLSGLVDNTVSGTLGTALTEATNASTNAFITSTMNTMGSAMSNTVIYGGNFKDMLKAGRDSLRDSDNWHSIAISTLGAGITSGVSKYIDGASGGVISRGAMEGASFKDQMYSALLENGLSNSVNVALESSINGDSFKESLERQGLNMLSGTIETLGARQIGLLAHDRMDLDSNGNIVYTTQQINRPEQLLLHAGLGAVTSKISGGDYLNGAVSGVVGEVVGELVFDKLNENSANKSGVFTVDQFNQNKETATNIAGLFSGLSSIIVSSSQGKDIDDISTNAYVGQRIGQNAAKYNSTNVVPVLDKNGNVVKDKYRVVGGDKDGDNGIYNAADNNKKIGESLFDDTFIMYDINGNSMGPALDSTINLDIDITDIIATKSEQAKDENILVVFNKSRTNGEYDLKKNGLTSYDGYVYNDKIITGRGAGNLLFGINAGNSSLSTIYEFGAGIYHIKSNWDNFDIKQYYKNNNLLNFGETNEAVKYIKYGINQQK